MENRIEFLKELHDLLDKYKVEISIGLDGDTHGLDSWIEITHQPDPKRCAYVQIATFNQGCVGAYELKPHIPHTFTELNLES